SSFIKKTVLAKLILYSLLTQFNLHPQPVMPTEAWPVCISIIIQSPAAPHKYAESLSHFLYRSLSPVAHWIA
ncbi:hypothetical protein GAY81_05120, partial [Phocaeicola vulgatus]